MAHTVTANLNFGLSRCTQLNNVEIRLHEKGIHGLAVTELLTAIMRGYFRTTAKRTRKPLTLTINAEDDELFQSLYALPSIDQHIGPLVGCGVAGMRVVTGDRSTKAKNMIREAMPRLQRKGVLLLD